jgi:cell division protein FtsI (penicillin-binding protein 3)
VQAPRVKTKPVPAIAEDDAPDQAGDINTLYAAINDLPSDDPLRATPAQSSSTGQAAKQAANLPAGIAANEKADAAQAASASRLSAPQQAGQQNPVSQPGIASPEQAVKSVMVSDGKKLRVPSLMGLPVRKVIEQAAAVGLAVQISGNGTVREQAPAAGTMVATGTQIVVRCGR